ncbi:protein transport protein Sec24-like At3g07100 [Phoenix dactylifera]|uniref:Protein transport protein Sec24-like At3g07100 n=1 Tax=Phoenix dactylifera TaxID=42345 RepID=A0A8B9ACA6_PHODC|nr:protein transport protein Sec24-like At3g07100 [Phoenix dactylifera]XP_017695953.2 protein transport protein Sec24-like At3g07100 [Phoenix dactylifera]XP_017695954.2 protein transport protein Sec24-like At3g07100 [Phoenix dactylifera]XP_038981573.1 protein transport protein Sec24-like At3g07100 [Phoenix dactylifera]
MQPMGNDKPTNVPGRPVSPFRAAPQSSTPFISSGPVVGLEASGASRATTPFLSSGPGTILGASGTPQTTVPFLSSGPITGTQMSNYRSPPPPPVRYNGPSSPPPPTSYPAQDATTYQQTQAPRFPPPGQPVTPFRGPVGSSGPSPSGSFRPQPQIPSVPMGPPPQTATQMSSRSNMPPPLSESSFSATRPPPQPSLQGYSYGLPRGNMPPASAEPQLPAPRSVSQPPLQQAFPSSHVPPVHASYHAHQGGVVPPPPPPIGGPLGYNSREQIQYPNIGPPIGGNLQGLVEEFQSLSVGSAPGSLDHGVDVKSLPRPLSGDEEPIKILETFPLNCHPRFLRLTTYAIPSSQSLLARWHLPLGAVVHPLAEVPDGEEVPIVNFGPAGIIRCRRCRTYVNPYVTFTDAGRKWRCNICSLLNDVSGEYYCALDASGRRCDVDQRPELSKGSVEFVAPTEYMVRPPMPPLYFFLIDVSVSAVRSGFLEVVATTIKSCLDELPGFPRTQIGFLTFDSTLHFHNLKSSLTQPQMLVVADLDDIFLPLPDDLLVNLSDSRHVVDALLDSLPSMFQDNANIESALGPALKAALMVMSQLGGKLLVFQSTLPSIGVGRLRLRGDDLRIYGTDKEHTLRIPDDPFYKQMAAEFTKHQIAVDVYAFSEKYTDIASLGSLAKYTGGQVYHYPSFQAPTHQEKLRYELARDLTRETAWESVMRVRCGKGVRFTTYHGHFMLRSTDLLALPAVDCDKAFAMQLSLEDTLMTTQTVYFQVALLYTSSSGERRIRVHTAAAHVVADLGEMYRQADTGAIILLLSRLAVENTLSHKLEDARQLMQLKLVKSLKEYRNLHVVQHRLGGRLIFPESLRFLPLYVLSLCKSLALRGGYADVPLDERCAAGYNMMILPIRRMLKLLYPGLYRIDENLIKGPEEFNESSKQLALSAQSLDPRALYIYDDGFSFIVWLGRMLSPDIVNNTLGVDLSGFPDLSRLALLEHDNEYSRKLMRIIRRLREKDPSCFQLCRVVRQGEQPREGSLLLSNLFEDQAAGTSGYVDWILQIYRQLQSS